MTCMRCDNAFTQSVIDPRSICRACHAAKARDRRAPGIMLGRWVRRATAYVESQVPKRVFWICSHCKEATLRAHSECSRNAGLAKARLRYAQDEAFRERIKARRVPKTAALVGSTLRCKECGEGFTYQLGRVGGARMIFCSTPCAERAARREYRRKHGHSNDATGPARRMRLGERDAWTCHLCWQVVDLNLQYPHPFSASLDHVTPRSMGGSHRRDNLKLAHLECNVKRGTKSVIEYQLQEAWEFGKALCGVCS